MSHIHRLEWYHLIKQQSLLCNFMWLGGLDWNADKIKLSEGSYHSHIYANVSLQLSFSIFMHYMHEVVMQLFFTWTYSFPSKILIAGKIHTCSLNNMDMGYLMEPFIWFWFYWMFYDHFSTHSLLAKLGRWGWWWGWGWFERKARRH